MQPETLQIKKNGCGTAPGNLVNIITSEHFLVQITKSIPNSIIYREHYNLLTLQGALFSIPTFSTKLRNKEILMFMVMNQVGHILSIA